MQEELNKLRQSTSQGLGGENAPSGAPAQSGNLTNLGSTLNNLNQTLNRLNQTLGQLRGISPYSSQPRSQPAVPPIVGSIGSAPQSWQAHPYGFGKFTDLLVKREVANAVRNAIAQDAGQDWIAQQLGGPRGIFGSLSGGLARNAIFSSFPGALAQRGIFGSLSGTEAQRKIFGDYFSGSSLGDLKRNKDLVDRSLAELDPYGPEAARPVLAQRKLNNEMIRAMRMFAGQYVLGELAGVGEMIGGKTGAVVSGGVQGAQSGLMTGAMMSMMGAGPATAAAAGIAAAAAKISSVMLEYAQKLAQAADKSYALLSRSKEQIEEQYKTAESIRFSRDLRNKDATELT